MPAPTITFSLQRPARTDGDPFTPSVFNAERALSVRVSMAGALPEEGGLVTGDQSVSGELLRPNGAAPSFSTFPPLEITGNAMIPELTIGTGGTPMRLLWSGSVAYSGWRDTDSPGVTRCKTIACDVPEFIPNSSAMPEVYALSAKHAVFAILTASNWSEPVTLANAWLGVGSAGKNKIFVSTEPLATCTFEQLMTNDPAYQITATLTLLVFRHTT